ncbi:small ribosomal subunit protein mS40 [Aulostomus maculatus]
MAASLQNVAKVLCRASPWILHPVRQYQWISARTPSLLPPCAPPSRWYCVDESPKEGDTAKNVSRYVDKPWDYLESEEYIEKYGTNPVWAGYRRNHKGSIPPQKTRKTCIRGNKTCGNPCPICRDPNVIISPQNVKLLQQFICPHSGIPYDHTRTGVCMKQQKILNQAINTARDQGLLPFQIPYVDFEEEDYSNSHDAVGCTTPSPSLVSGDTWYKWYAHITPDEKEVAKVRKTYKAYLKQSMVLQ